MVVPVFLGVGVTRSPDNGIDQAALDETSLSGRIETIEYE